MAQNNKIDMSALIDDRADANVFRIHRSAYLDPDLFDSEIERIFHRLWVYLCHESQVPQHGDYVATVIGRHPVLVIRGEDGKIRGVFTTHVLTVAPC